jgi:acetyl esterase/lipase
LIEVRRRGAPVTVVAFSGIAPQNHLFEWTRSFSGLRVNLIGVKDRHNCWYQDKPKRLAKKIARAVVSCQGERMVLIGGSAGGFAALLFSRWLHPDRILAFSPQTICGAGKRVLGDSRFPEYCNSIGVTKHADVAGRYPASVIHYASDEPLDALHASRVECQKVEWPRGGHALPKYLKAENMLEPIITEAVTW